MNDRYAIGARFGSLTIVSRLEPRGTNSYFLLRCDCGQLKTAAQSALVQGTCTDCSTRLPDGRRLTCKLRSEPMSIGRPSTLFVPPLVKTF